MQIEQQWLLQCHFSCNVLKIPLQCLRTANAYKSHCSSSSEKLLLAITVNCTANLQRSTENAASPSLEPTSPCSTLQTFLLFYFAYLCGASIVLGCFPFRAVTLAPSGQFPAQGSVLEQTLFTFCIYLLLDPFDFICNLLRSCNTLSPPCPSLLS